jgi:dCTP deaminase
MILSNIDIKNYIDQGKITIVPHMDEKIYPASYVFTLGEQLLRPIGDNIIDFRKKLLPEYEELYITEEYGYTIHPGDFILGQTREKITLCPEIAMIIEGRSELARCGIEVVQTSTFIEPNHTNSIITLEIKNNSKSSFVLYPHMKFAKGIFVKLLTPSDQEANQGTYITQTEVDPPKLKDIFNYE